LPLTGGFASRAPTLPGRLLSARERLGSHRLFFRTREDLKRVDISAGIQASLAGRYASALFDLASENGTVTAVESDLDKIEAALAESAELAAVTTNPKVSRSDAQKALSGRLKELVGPNGITVAYDAVGGEYAEPVIRAMGWDGRYLVVGFPAGIPKIPLNLTLLKSCQIVGVFWGASVMRDPKGHARNVYELFSLYSDGRIKPRITARYPLERAAEALEAMAGRKVTGKVVITFD